MKHFFLCLIFFSKFLIAPQLNAQNITGTWQGQTGSEFFQLNLTQSGTQICGYTYDHSVTNVKDFCKAYYIGKYEDGFLILNGTGFIAKSRNHVLMRIALKLTYESSELVMVGRVLTGAYDFEGLQDGQLITMRRVSKIPNKIPGTNSACFTERSKILDENDEGSDPDAIVKTSPLPNPVIKPKPVQKVPVLSPTPKPPVKVTPKPTPVQETITNRKKPVPLQPNIILREPDALPPLIAQRKKVEQGRLTVNVRELTLNLYDNGVVDGDTVTVYYNGKLIVNKKRLSTAPVVINLVLEDNVTTHEIVLFAENLGSIAPNTALIVVTAGKKRYELRSSADLSKNAVLVFEYVPDE